MGTERSAADLAALEQELVVQHQRFLDLDETLTVEIKAAEAERDTLRDELAQTGEYLRTITQRAVAAEAEVARLNHENGKLEEEARALREALTEMGMDMSAWDAAALADKEGT